MELEAVWVSATGQDSTRDLRCTVVISLFETLNKLWRTIFSQADIIIPSPFLWIKIGSVQFQILANVVVQRRSLILR